MKLTLDFETRSACDLKKHGAEVYSEHPTTDVLCLAVKAPKHAPVLWKRGDMFGDLCREIREADIIEAHNASFERAIWQNVCVKRYGWPPLPLEKLRCSAAKASMHALPRSLQEAGEVLGLAQQKDFEGHRVMLKLCKPRKPRKDEPEWNPDDPFGLYWNEDPEDFKKLYTYCMQDVVSEEALSDALGDLPEQELRIWQLDQKINSRGIQADLVGARAMMAMVGEHESILLRRLGKLTNGVVKTAKQVDALRAYLRGLGVDLPDLGAATVKTALEGELSDVAREILEIRRSLGRSSSAKYQSIIDRASADGRVRGSLLYHGAGTGRWSGSGIQPQNFPSRIKIAVDPEMALGVVLAGGYELHQALLDDDPTATAGAVTRSVLTAAPGKDLVVADYSAIEGRGLAWLVGEDTELDIYRKHDKGEGPEIYIATAAMILHKPYDKITKDERQSPGKVATLACGYGGGVGAVRKFGGEGLEDREILEQIVWPWREAHPMTLVFWKELELACMAAVKERGRIFSARGVSYKVDGRYLMCRLPTGRLLYYSDPYIVTEKLYLIDDKWVRVNGPGWDSKKASEENSRIVQAVTYMTVDSLIKKWIRTKTYGGKLAENVTQAICRDLMAEAMLRVEAAGYPVVLTVHDEIVCEVPEGFGSVAEFESIMCQTPAWAKGFPIKASGWRGKRYKKC